MELMRMLSAGYSARKFRVLAFFWLHTLAFAACLTAADLPWTVAIPQNDTRDAEMQEWDELDSMFKVELMNREERMAGGRFIWWKTPLRDLLEVGTPFVEMRIDPVHPMELTAQEKSVLKEWLLRGGFLLLFEDAYPYDQEEFRKHASLPVFDFLLKELPASDPGFQVGMAEDDHVIFNVVYPTETVPWMVEERSENPNYRGRTYLEYKGRMVAFCLGRYSVRREGRWVPKARPFTYNFSSDARAYYLVLNLYAYATMH